MTTIQERVEAGAAWLDANRPGWVDRINLETLALERCFDCVLGQIYGDFCDRPEDLRGRATDFGFDSGGLGRKANSELTAVWRDYITARRAA